MAVIDQTPLRTTDRETRNKPKRWFQVKHLVVIVVTLVLLVVGGPPIGWPRTVADWCGPGHRFDVTNRGY